MLVTQLSLAAAFRACFYYFCQGDGFILFAGLSLVRVIDLDLKSDVP